MGSQLPDDGPRTPMYGPYIVKGKPADLETPTESLQNFKARVDRLLATLDKSPAAHARITDQKVTTSAYGTGFPEAIQLSGAYDTVHARLEMLSKTLGDQLEAMGITVDLADRGYQNVDQEHADRLFAIQKRTEIYYKKPGAETDPGSPAAGKDKTGGGSSSGTDGM
ncbi:hypothetical protein QMK19_21595 [Streptomyces sp. H10-C2]|uniref:hypothetical protein n=1 Tax=unclassified Streptomyces TaxID=2593676 RepID=UPI0024BA81F6|nr:MULTISPECIES: hypothetical protein [unclassified Streptomyces]MDJ0342331.1 hypothetical protein [Streptomyces sp. PH10-H1]MDJ0372186.1 hypothetical protein [Streptomyces sp. H10-C2]